MSLCAFWLSACDAASDNAGVDASAGGALAGAGGASSGGRESGGARSGGGSSNGGATTSSETAGATSSGGARQSGGAGGTVDVGGRTTRDAGTDANSDAGRDASQDGDTTRTDASGVVDAGGCGVLGARTPAVDPVIGCAAISPSATATWELVSPAGDNSYTGTYLSADGSTIAGTFVDSSVSGFYWTAAEGIETLGSAFDPTGVSCDGSVIVGNDYAARVPYRWTRAGGAVALPRTGNVEGLVNAVSADGRIMAGGEYPMPDSVPLPVRWSWAPTGVTAAVGLENGLVTLLSASGNLALGIDSPATGAQDWCSWVAGRCEVLNIEGAVKGVSSDGRVVFGSYGYSAGNVTVAAPFRFIAPTCQIDMPCPPGTQHCLPVGVSSSGRYLALVTEDDTGFGLSFLWDPVHGYRDLKQLFVDHGIAISTSEEVLVTDISDDGLVFLGMLRTYGTVSERVFRGALPPTIYD